MLCLPSAPIPPRLFFIKFSKRIIPIIPGIPIAASKTHAADFPANPPDKKR
jgi:hypothetical protein